MDVAITGASGLIGTALRAALEARSDRVIPVVRGTRDGLHWDPAAGTIDADGFEGIDAVVNLAGEGIAEKRWTQQQKDRIRDSRVDGTSMLATTLGDRIRPPSVLVSGSAVGWYGDRDAEQLTEASPPPSPPDFLAQVCLAWEAATTPASAAGIRTVHLRTGIVLSKDGGTLARLVTPFKLGLGGRVGPGTQYMSWISIDDAVGAILHAIDVAALEGPVNVTAPNPVTNRAFTDALGSALHRPTVLPTPLFPLKMVYGSELVEHLLLVSQRVLPDRLLDTGYSFSHPDIADSVHRDLRVSARDARASRSLG